MAPVSRVTTDLMILTFFSLFCKYLKLTAFPSILRSIILEGKISRAVYVVSFVARVQLGVTLAPISTV